MSFCYDTWEKILVFKDMFLEPYGITIDKNASFASYIWIRGVVGTLKFTSATRLGV